MLNRDGTVRLNKDQCAYCVVRRIGICHGYGQGEGLDLSKLEAAHLPIRVYQPGDVIYRQGEASDMMFNVISGWVDLHQDMPDGRRQISQFLLSGAVFGLKPRGVSCSHGATAITSASVCAIPISRVDELRQISPAFNEHFIWMLEREHHLAIETLTIIGQGASLERVSRILWCLASVMSGSTPLKSGASMRIPLTQRLIAEATGLTAIHVNRVIRRLREQQVVDFGDGIMVVGNPGRLAELANANPESPAHWGEAVSSAPDPLSSLSPVAPRQASIRTSFRGV